MYHACVHGSSVGVFVTNTHVSKADKSFSDGAAVASLPSLHPECSEQEKAGDKAPGQVGSRDLGTPEGPALPGAGL